jgi:hypothetical protein
MPILHQCNNVVRHIIPTNNQSTMRFIASIILLFNLTLCFGQKEMQQKIDSGNYYKFFSNNGNIDWLRQSDAVPIIIDEIEKAGYSKAFISIGDLVNSGTEGDFVLTVSYNNEKRFGFIFESGHGIPIRDRDRREFYQIKNKHIVQVSRNLDNKIEYATIKKYPTNTFFLYETCYWFQYSSSGDNFPVSKKVAEYILRQDIRYCLNRVR